MKALLAAVVPRIALISCGVRNRFEHPRPSVLARLRAAGVRTLRTDRLGSVTWLTDGERTWLRAFPSG
jgi:competence protein ComEC